MKNGKMRFVYEIGDAPCRACDIDDVLDDVEDFPAADVRPVVKAKWEWNNNNGYYYCGNCKAISPREDQYGEYIDCPNFCPNCGAAMEES
jgi:hypothetical protein